MIFIIFNLSRQTNPNSNAMQSMPKSLKSFTIESRIFHFFVDQTLSESSIPAGGIHLDPSLGNHLFLSSSRISLALWGKNIVSTSCSADDFLRAGKVEH